MKYKIYEIFNKNIVFQTNKLKEAQKFIIENEGSSYNEYLEYKENCIEEHEKYIDYYPTYYVEYDGEKFDIINIGYLLKK